MTIRLEDNAIQLVGKCGVEEVELLVSYLEGRTDISVDVSAATAVHTALWQALMVFKPNLIGQAASPLMADRLLAGLEDHIASARELEGNKLANASSSQ